MRSAAAQATPRLIDCRAICMPSFVRVTIDDEGAAQRELAQSELQELVQRVSQAPGFAAGYWTRKDNNGLSMVVFESEEAATKMSEQVRDNAPGRHSARRRSTRGRCARLGPELVASGSNPYLGSRRQLSRGERQARSSMAYLVWRTRGAGDSCAVVRPLCRIVAGVRGGEVTRSVLVVGSRWRGIDRLGGRLNSPTQEPTAPFRQSLLVGTIACVVERQKTRNANRDERAALGGSMPALVSPLGVTLWRP